MERCDCGGELIPLGVLGTLAHSRCRDCGLQVEASVPLELMRGESLGENEPQQNDGGFKNLQGDGPSGFDYWQDTKRCP